MKKYIYGILGVLVGFSLSLTITTHADSIKSLIGLTVSATFPVKISGQSVTQDAILVDNKTYLPVRAMGEALGYDIGFDADLGVTLNKSEAKKLVDDANAVELGKIAKQEEDDANAAIAKNNADNGDKNKNRTDINLSISKLTEQISNLNYSIKVDQDAIDRSSKQIVSFTELQKAMSDPYVISLNQTAIDNLNIGLKTSQDDQTTLKSQLSDLQSQLDTLNTQLTDLSNPSPSPSPVPAQ